MTTVSPREAFHFMLSYHNLFGALISSGKDGIMNYFDRVRTIQYDPLDPAGRNADLVLQSRIKNIKKKDLFNLLYQKRALIDGWDKVMSIYHADDYPFFQPLRNKAIRESRIPEHQLKPVREEINVLLTRKDSLNSSDLSFQEVINWSWAPTRFSRAALESLYDRGELQIHHKEGTRRYYSRNKDFTQEVSIDKPDFLVERIYRRIRSAGLVWNKPSDVWVGISNTAKENREKAFAALSEEKRIIPLHVKGIDVDFYYPANAKSILTETLNGKKNSRHARLLAPLDNLMWDRKLIEALTGFCYTWEVYKPAVKREYGYYVLPVLYGNRFAGRCEPSFDKKNKTLYIKNWWWEKKFKLNQSTIKAIEKAVVRLGKYLDAENYQMNL